MPTWCAGSATPTDGWTAPGPPTPNSPSWPPASHGCSGTGPGSPAPGDDEDKSPVTGDRHAGSVGARGCNAPGYPTPGAGRRSAGEVKHGQRPAVQIADVPLCAVRQHGDRRRGCAGWELGCLGEVVERDDRDRVVAAVGDVREAAVRG